MGQQRAHIDSLQDLCNIRGNVLYIDVQIHKVNGIINDICTQIIILESSNLMLEILLCHLYYVLILFVYICVCVCV